MLHLLPHLGQAAPYFVIYADGCLLYATGSSLNLTIANQSAFDTFQISLIKHISLF